MEHVDLEGGLVYKMAKTAEGILAVDIPFEIVHHGEMTKADELAIKDLLCEYVKLVRFQVTYNEVAQTPEGKPLPGGHQLNVAVGISSNPGPRTHLGLGGAYGTYSASKLIKLAEVGARTAVSDEIMAAMKKADIVESARKFEGPVWVKQVEPGDEPSDDNVAYIEDDDGEDNVRV